MQPYINTLFALTVPTISDTASVLSSPQQDLTSAFEDWNEVGDQIISPYYSPTSD